MLDSNDQKIIVDTSSLIALSKLDLVFVLRDLYGEVIVPESVSHEFAQDLPPWIRVVAPRNIPLVIALREKLGYGETEVIALGIEKKDCLLVLDDHKARQTAKRLGLKITGLLGMLVKAKKKGKIDEIKPLLDQLDRGNFHISHGLKAEILKIAGE
jgi:predicted nucleic acid-binding protein